MPQMGQASWVARLSSFEFKYQLGLINYLELVYKHPKDFRKIHHPEVELFLYFYFFSKEVSQLTD